MFPVQDRIAIFAQEQNEQIVQVKRAAAEGERGDSQAEVLEYSTSRKTRRMAFVCAGWSS